MHLIKDKRGVGRTTKTKNRHLSGQGPCPTQSVKFILDLLMNAESYAEKYVSFKAEFNSLQLRFDELKSAAEDCLSVVAKAQADKH
nr:60S ribosomal protein L17-2 [Tanacetum cinerariifolium]